MPKPDLSMRTKKYTEAERIVWATTFAFANYYGGRIGEAVQTAARSVKELRALAKKVTKKSGPSYQMLREMTEG
jgi:hypothetical protein